MVEIIRINLSNSKELERFIDVINDFSVAQKLLDTAKNWLHTEGLEKMVGPCNFSTECQRNTIARETRAIVPNWSFKNLIRFEKN